MTTTETQTQTPTPHIGPKRTAIMLSASILCLVTIFYTSQLLGYYVEGVDDALGEQNNAEVLEALHNTLAGAVALSDLEVVDKVIRKRQYQTEYTILIKNQLHTLVWDYSKSRNRHIKLITNTDGVVYKLAK